MIKETICSQIICKVNIKNGAVRNKVNSLEKYLNKKGWCEIKWLNVWWFHEKCDHILAYYVYFALCLKWIYK